MAPTGNESPELALPENVAIPQLSFAVAAVNVTTAAHCSASAVWVMSEGVPAMTGSSSSVTVMSKVEVAVLPEASVAV